MIPVEQDVTSIPGGNCFAACVASLLELPLSQVPNFCIAEGDWWEGFQSWLGRRGLFAFEVELSDRPTIARVPAGAWCIVSGKSPRGPHLHSVVARGAWERGYELIHDPHPAQAWIDGEPRCITVIAPLNPAIDRGATSPASAADPQSAQT